MPAVTVLVVSVARGKWERCEAGDFKCAAYACGNARVGKILLAAVDQEPTSTARNMVAAQAYAMGLAGEDLVFMLDNDHVPNVDFFNHAVNWLGEHPGPACIGSPYCSSAPEYDVQVLIRDQNNFIRRIRRDEAAEREGTEEVIAVGTGVFAVKMSAFDLAPRPYFDYLYNGPDRIRATQTEDFYFCSNLTAAGGKVFAAWNCWSYHVKPELIGKPHKIMHPPASDGYRYFADRPPEKAAEVAP